MLFLVAVGNIDISQRIAKKERKVLIEVGFMGTALLKGLLKRQAETGQNLVQLAACVQSPESLARLQTSLGDQANKVTLGNGNDFAIEIVEEARVVILGVRPSDFEGLFGIPKLAQALSNRTVVSMLAGMSTSKLDFIFTTKGFPRSSDIVRLMPTIGAQNGGSVSLLAQAAYKDPGRVILVRELFSLVGSVIDIPENLINHGVAVGATSHALSLIAVDAITDAGVAEGLPRPIAATLAVQSLRSAIGMLEGGMPVEQLKEALSTPNGITLNSVVNYDRGGVRGGIAENTQKAIQYACSM